jgi:hypothetical protein
MSAPGGKHDGPEIVAKQMLNRLCRAGASWWRGKRTGSGGAGQFVPGNFDPRGFEPGEFG